MKSVPMPKSFDLMMRLFMRGFDRVKIALSPPKRSAIPQRPYTTDYSGLICEDYLEDPSLFYSPPSPINEVKVHDVERLDFASREYISFATNHRLIYEHIPDCHVNDTCYALHTKVDSRDRLPLTLIILPGWGRRHLEAEKKVCGWFAEAGIETLVMVMPFHLQRAPKGAWSGEYMVSGDVVRTAESFRQTVAEVRGIMAYLRRRNEKVGILGMSLGGIIAHLAMAVERFDVGITMLAGGDSAAITWHGILTSYVRRDIRNAGIDLTLLRKVWMAAAPTKLAKHNLVRDLLMIAGKYDEIVPTRYTVELWEALGRPRISWYPCAHYSACLFLRKMIDEIIEFIHDVCARSIAEGGAERRAARRRA